MGIINRMYDTLKAVKQSKLINDNKLNEEINTVIDEFKDTYGDEFEELCEWD